MCAASATAHSNRQTNGATKGIAARIDQVENEGERKTLILQGCAHAAQQIAEMRKGESGSTYLLGV